MTIYKGSSEGNFVLRAVEGGFARLAAVDLRLRVVSWMGRCFLG